MSNLIRFETADTIVNMGSVVLDRESIIGYGERGDDTTLLYLKHGHSVLVDGSVSDVVEKVLRSRYRSANDQVIADRWVDEEIKNLGYAGLESNTD